MNQPPYRKNTEKPAQGALSEIHANIWDAIHKPLIQPQDSKKLLHLALTTKAMPPGTMFLGANPHAFWQLDPESKTFAPRAHFSNTIFLPADIANCDGQPIWTNTINTPNNIIYRLTHALYFYTRFGTLLLAAKEYYTENKQERAVKRLEILAETLDDLCSKAKEAIFNQGQTVNFELFDKKQEEDDPDAVYLIAINASTEVGSDVLGPEHFRLVQFVTALTKDYHNNPFADSRLEGDIQAIYKICREHERQQIVSALQATPPDSQIPLEKSGSQKSTNIVKAIREKLGF